MGWSFPFCKFSLKPGADTGFQKEISPSSTHFIRARRGNEDSDLRAGRRPGSTWTGQPARLDRAGSQTRTRLLGAVQGFALTNHSYLRILNL